MKVEEVGRIEMLVASLRSRNDIWRQEILSVQKVIDGPKTSRAEKDGFPLQSEKPRRGQTCNWRKGKHQEKATKMSKTTPREEIASFGP